MMELSVKLVTKAMNFKSTLHAKNHFVQENNKLLMVLVHVEIVSTTVTKNASHAKRNVSLVLLLLVLCVKMDIILMVNYAQNVVPIVNPVQVIPTVKNVNQAIHSLVNPVRNKNVDNLLLQLEGKKLYVPMDAVLAEQILQEISFAM